MHYFFNTKILSLTIANEAERSLPRICFAAGTEILTLSVGIGNILATDTMFLNVEVRSRKVTHARWNQRLADHTMTETVRELSVSMEALATSFALAGITM